MNKQRIIAILKKEFAQLFKDKKLLPLVFLAPVMQLIFLGYAASLDVKNIVMVVCDQNKTQTSRELVERFTNTGYFVLKYTTDDYASLGNYLDNHKAVVAIVIPPDFDRRIARKETAKLQILLDGSQGNTAAITVAYITQITSTYGTEIITETIGGGMKIGGVSAETRALFNPSMISRNYMVPGVLVLLLLITTTNLTAMAIVKEKEIGTLEQIMVTPITPTELILGKILPFIIIAFFDVVVVLCVMVFFFGIPIKGSVPLLFLLSGFFLLTTLGLGLFISTLARTQQQAMMTSMFFMLMPMMYISGFAFPIENMPVLLQCLSYVSPMRYFLIIVRSIVLKGVGLSTLWFEATMLLFMGSTILVASVLRFHKKLD